MTCITGSTVSMACVNLLVQCVLGCLLHIYCYSVHQHLPEMKFCLILTAQVLVRQNVDASVDLISDAPPQLTQFRRSMRLLVIL